MPTPNSADKPLAHDNGDGSFTLPGVRIFGEFPKGSNGYDYEITKEWLEAAVVNAKKRFERDGYMAPAHVYHHSSGQAEHAGAFLPQSVELLPYEGKWTFTVRADLRVPAAIKDRIERGELSYRSVEIRDYDAREFSSLALLPDQEPFFKYGLLGIAGTVPASGASFLAVATYAANPAGAVAAARRGKALMGLFHYEKEASVPEPEKKPPVPAAPAAPVENAADPAAAPVAKKPSAFQRFLKFIAASASYFDDDSEGEEQEEAPPAENAAAPAPAAPAAPAPKDPANKPKPPVEMKENTMDATEFAALKDRLDKIDADNATAATKSKTDALAATAIGKLEGRNLSQADKDLIGEFAALGDEAKLGKLVEALKTRRGPRDLENEFAVVGADGSMGGEPAEVAEYANRGPDQHARARKLASDHAKCRARGMRSSLKEFLAANIGANPQPVSEE